MPTYQYHVSDHKGITHDGELEAASREDLALYLSHKGLFLISLEEKKEGEERKSRRSIFGGSFSLADRQILFEDLSTMVGAGLTLSDSVKILREDAEKKILVDILMDFQFTLEKGEPFSIALQRYPQFFPEVVINLVKAGEASGTLERTLRVIATQFQKDSDLKRKITGALIYPSVLLFLSTAVIIIMLIFVVPRLSQFFSQAHLQLPFMTRVIVALGNLVSGSIILDIALVLFFVGGAVFLSKTGRGKQLLLNFLSHFPLTRGLFRQLYLYRYCWTMSVLLESGVDILESIRVTQNVLTDKAYKNALKILLSKVSTGISLGAAMKDLPRVFPRTVAGLTSVGEKTGSLSKIYLSLSHFYERNFSGALKTMVILLEPALLLIMGVIVGSIALAVVLPIYTFVSGVS